MKKPKWKIGVWGQFGDGGKIADGQAVRTTIITKELQNRYGENKVGVANTNNWKQKPLSFLHKSISLIANSEKVAIAPADNGFKVFVPLLIFFNWFYKRNLIFIVIGGFLPALLKSKPAYLKMVNKFCAVFVQTNNMKKDLEELGVKNLFLLSNPKRLDKRKYEDLQLNRNTALKVCIFSRINKEKGIEDAIEAVKLANKSLGKDYIKLDLYGLLPESYKERFIELLEQNNDIISYKGIVDYYNTVEVLQQYFVLLFPTYYYGEGFPGNVVDAYNTGLPIIATKWLYNADVIKDEINGLLVPIKNPQAICDALLRLYDDRELHFTLARNNLKEAEKYMPDKVLKEFYFVVES